MGRISGWWVVGGGWWWWWWWWWQWCSGAAGAAGAVGAAGVVAAAGRRSLLAGLLGVGAGRCWAWAWVSLPLLRADSRLSHAPGRLLRFRSCQPNSLPNSLPCAAKSLASCISP